MTTPTEPFRPTHRHRLTQILYQVLTTAQAEWDRGLLLTIYRSSNGVVLASPVTEFDGRCEKIIPPVTQSWDDRLNAMTQPELEDYVRELEQMVQAAPGFASANEAAKMLKIVIYRIKTRFGATIENKYPIRKG